MGWAILIGAILAAVVVLGGTGMWVWSQFSLIRSNRSLAKSYGEQARQLRNRPPRP